LALAVEVVGLVEVIGVGEAGEGDLGGVAYFEIGVECFFEVQRGFGLVRYRKAEAELAAEDYRVGELEVVEA